MKPRSGILVTGFEPFGEERTNPSAAIAAALDGREFGGQPVTGTVLPVVFGESRRRLDALLRELRPRLVICLGVAGNRTAITPERVAINLDDARAPDNAGQQPIDQPVVPGGPVAYWTSLPVKAMAAAIADCGVEVKLSETAGTYVCNHVFYGLMHRLVRQRGVRGGFVHVPRVRADLTQETMTAALAAAIDAAVAAID